MIKNILIAVPQIAGLDRLIADNLRHHGFHPINIMEDDLGFTYPSLLSRIKSKWHKLLTKNDEVRKQIKWQTLQPQIAAKIAAAGGLDYALFISADRYHIDFLKFIKSQCRHSMVNYQFDGLRRFDSIFAKIQEFDRFFVFDKHDLDLYPHLQPATNFYFDHDLDKLPESGSNFYFLGTHHPSRIEVINRFADYAAQRNLNLDMTIVWHKNAATLRETYPNNQIQFISKRAKQLTSSKNHIIDFKENIKKSQQAAILLDFVVSDHQGLSFRCFEALGYRKKLITTNPTIIHYDFYHPNNILVWNEKDFTAIDEFLNKPYQELMPEIYQKYSFSNWIRYILNIEFHQKITLPES